MSIESYLAPSTNIGTSSLARCTFSVNAYAPSVFTQLFT